VKEVLQETNPENPGKCHRHARSARRKETKARDPKLSKGSPHLQQSRISSEGSQINKAAIGGMQGKATIGHEIDQGIYGREGGTKKVPYSTCLFG